jgi:hypothetical protein
MVYTRARWLLALGLAALGLAALGGALRPKAR